MSVFPGTPPPTVESATTVEADGYRTTRIEIDSHTGTHIDAPAHMLADGPTLDEYPLETFHFEAAIADCRPLEDREPIGVDVLEGAVPPAVSQDGDVDLLVVRTGWERHWNTPSYADHPFLTAAAADWLVDQGLHLGLDTLNPDPTPTAQASQDEPDGHPVHLTLFEDDRLILENLRGLEPVQEPARITLHAVPLSIHDADGAPVRAVASVPDSR